MDNKFDNGLILRSGGTTTNLMFATVTCGNRDKNGCYDLSNLKVEMPDGKVLRYGFDYKYEVVYYTEIYVDYVAGITIYPIGGGYVGSKNAKFVIEKRYNILDPSNFSLNTDKLIYNGEFQQPTVISNNYAEGKHYTVNFAYSKDVGKYNIVIKGIKTHTGIIELPFEILPKSIKNGKYLLGDLDENYNCDINNLIFLVDEIELVKKKDYNLYYSTILLSDGLIGANVTVTGIRNYCDSFFFRCSIQKLTIFGKREITLDRAPIYVRYYGYESCGIKSGIFYLWDDIVINNRVKICSSMDNCGITQLIIGWVNVSDLDYKRPINNNPIFDSEDDESIPPPKAGDEIKLYSVNLYDMFDSNKVVNIITGKFFISKEIIYNNRIRICAFREDVGVSKKVIGWIGICDIYNKK